MDVTEVLSLHFELKLPEGLNEGHALNVPDCASQLSGQSTSLGNRQVHVQAHVCFLELYITVREEQTGFYLHLCAHFVSKLTKQR